MAVAPQKPSEIKTLWKDIKKSPALLVTGVVGIAIVFYLVYKSNASNASQAAASQQGPNYYIVDTGTTPIAPPVTTPTSPITTPTPPTSTHDCPQNYAWDGSKCIPILPPGHPLPQPPTPTPPTPSTPARTQIVGHWPDWSGSLWGIAKHWYGNGADYMRIAAANNINNPSLIYPGQVLTIP